ncbi:MAG: DNA translocase FtsK 4TM domain-containing protein, partial [Bacteroidales bacterium]|nr:DNA translocase FtsK 4TM domain-containing protein [Bacteroidales bacterium]
MLRLWKNMDEEDKTRLVKTTGFVIALFTVFTLLATVSYFFTWKVDQSALAAPVGDTSVEIRNLAGKLGYRWSDLLVRRWFGLGSLALIVILFAVSVRLLLQRWHYSMLKTVLLTVSGALVASFILSFVSDLFGWSNVFGGGLGGECGEAVVGWSRNLFGPFITGLLILLLLALWLFFVSERFSRWFASLGDAPAKEEDQPAVRMPEKPVSSEPRQKVMQPVSSLATKETTVVRTPVKDVPSIHDEASMVRKESASEDNAARGTSGGTASIASGGAERSEASEVPTPSGQNQPLEVIKDDTLSTEVKKELPRINVRDELPNYKFPSLELLEEYSSGHHEVTDEELARNNNKIRATLESYRIQINDVKAIVGPTVTLYKVYPAPGVKIAEIKKLQEDIGMYLHARGVRVVTLTDSVGIEVANDKPSIVPMRAVLNDDAFRTSKAELPIAIGYTIQQKV